MSAIKLLPNYKYADYCQWQGNWEVIEGIAYSMSPMPNPKHQSLTGSIHSLFLRELKKRQCSCKVYQPIDMIIAENTIVCPDILIVCKPIEKNYLDFPPDLVVEIFSPSTKLKDQNTKFDLYQNFGIKYYVMVDPDTEEITIHQLVDGKYQLIKNDDEFIEFEDGCQVPSDLKEIFTN
jgi:Uma2 family endonuclease